MNEGSDNLLIEDVQVLYLHNFLNEELSDKQIQKIFGKYEVFESMFNKTIIKYRSKTRLTVYSLFCKYKKFKGENILANQKIKRIKNWSNKPNGNMAFSVDVLDVFLSFYNKKKIKPQIEEYVKRDIESSTISKYESKLPFSFTRKRLYNLMRKDDVTLNMRTTLLFTQFYKIRLVVGARKPK